MMAKFNGVSVSAFLLALSLASILFSGCAKPIKPRPLNASETILAMESVPGYITTGLMMLYYSAWGAANTTRFNLETGGEVIWGHEFFQTQSENQKFIQYIQKRPADFYKTFGLAFHNPHYDGVSIRHDVTSCLLLGKSKSLTIHHLMITTSLDKHPYPVALARLSLPSARKTTPVRELVLTLQPDMTETPKKKPPLWSIAEQDHRLNQFLDRSGLAAQSLINSETRCQSPQEQKV